MLISKFGQTYDKKRLEEVNLRKVASGTNVAIGNAHFKMKCPWLCEFTRGYIHFSEILEVSRSFSKG